MGIVKKLFGKKEPELPELYEEKQGGQIERYIQERFGAFESVFHEIVSPDIHVDIALIGPAEERDYYTLVTMGMGAHRMNVPKELADYCLERAEIVAYLPSDWKLGSDDERWYWPLRWMKILARLPIEQDTWLGFGHTVPNGEPFAENTKLSGVMLISPTEKEREVLELEDGEIVTFYQMLPIYEEEMNYKLESSAEALLEKFDSCDLRRININRKNYCTD